MLKEGNQSGRYTDNLDGGNINEINTLWREEVKTITLTPSHTVINKITICI